VESCAVESGPIVILMHPINNAKEELFTYLSRKRFYHRIRVYALQEVRGQVCFQEIVC
jgi:hypothetical protein